MEHIQNIIYSVIDKNATKVEGKPLTINPHLFHSKPSITTGDDDYKTKRLAPWDTEWPVLGTFLERNPNLTGEDVVLAYHGTRNVNRVSHIMLEGIRPSMKAFTKDRAFFGVDAERCAGYDELILFVVPKSKMGQVRGDRAFDMNVFDTLPVGCYQYQHSLRHHDLIHDCLPRKHIK